MPDFINGIADTAINNYSGILYRRGNAETPLLSIIGGKRRLVNSYRFVTGQEYTLPEAEIPNISDRQSQTAPPPISVTRKQDFNVTQIFQASVGSSYYHESSMGALSGVNNAGQSANPVSELDFQIVAAMRKMGTDIEKTIIQGVYHEAASPNEANRTRGLVEAIRSNVFDIGGAEISMWDLAELLVAMGDAGAETYGLVLWCDAVTQFQLCKEAEAYSIRPVEYDYNGINITRLVTPAGNIDLRVGRYLPAGTALVLNLGVLGSAEQTYKDKGNFFYEELAKTGAGTNGQIYGVFGLDYGPEFYHGKITGINHEFIRPKRGVTVNVAAPVPTVETLPQIDSVKITDTSAGFIAYKADYVGIPTSTPTEQVEYLVSNNPVNGFAPVPAVTADMVGKYVKVRVTATGTATGTATSGSKKITQAIANIMNVSGSATTASVTGNVILDKAASGSVEVTVSKDGSVVGSTTVSCSGGVANCPFSVDIAGVSTGNTLTIDVFGNGNVVGTASTTVVVA